MSEKYHQCPECNCILEKMDELHKKRNTENFMETYAFYTNQEKPDICCGDCSECQKLIEVDRDEYELTQLDTGWNHVRADVYHYVTMTLFFLLTFGVIASFVEYELYGYFGQGILVCFLASFFCCNLGIPTDNFFEVWCRTKYPESFRKNRIRKFDIFYHKLLKIGGQSMIEVCVTSNPGEGGLASLCDIVRCWSINMIKSLFLLQKLD